MSVHASPQQADPALYGWTGADVQPRDGGGDPRYTPRRLWDSDLALETLHLLSESGPLLAAGDLNEARDFDLVNGEQVGSWGQEYFQRLKEAGLHDVTFERWGEERPTRGTLQLDHVLHNDGTKGLLDGLPAPELDTAWSDQDHALSDHTPIWFRLRLP